MIRCYARNIPYWIDKPCAGCQKPIHKEDAIIISDRENLVYHQMCYSPPTIEVEKEFNERH